MVPLKLVRHTVFNLLGQGLPLVVALWAVPQLHDRLGAAQLGILLLMLAVSTYFSLFDLGLGRVLTRQTVRSHWRAGSVRLVGSYATTSLVLSLLIGLFLWSCMASGLPLLLAFVPQADRIEEVSGVAKWTSALIPLLLLTSWARGMLEAAQAFGVLNALRLPTNLWNFLGPIGALDAGGGLLDVAIWLWWGRALFTALHVVAAFRQWPGLMGALQWRVQAARKLYVQGRWLMLSNVLAPLMGYGDRLIVGLLVSAAAIAWYATPQELVLRLWIIPGALTAVLFPVFSGHGRSRANMEEVWKLHDRANSALAVCMLPLCLGLAIWAKEGMTWWMGEPFARQSAPALQVLALGVWINCMAHIPLNMLYAKGYFRQVAWMYLAVLPPFVIVLLALTWKWGVVGAAWAWTLRAVAEAAILTRMIQLLRPGWTPWLGWLGQTGMVSLAVWVVPQWSQTGRGVISLALCAGAALFLNRLLGGWPRWASGGPVGRGLDVHPIGKSGVQPPNGPKGKAT